MNSISRRVASTPLFLLCWRNKAKSRYCCSITSTNGRPSAFFGVEAEQQGGCFVGHEQSIGFIDHHNRFTQAVDDRFGVLLATVGQPSQRAGDR